MARKIPISGDQENRLLLMEQGKHAALAFHYTRAVVADLEQSIIARLVGRYRSNILTNDDVRGGVGELAGLRTLLSTLETDVKKGNIARKEEMNDGR